MPHKQAERAEMILLSADVVPSSEIVRRVRTSYPTLTRWGTRFDKVGVKGLRKNETRSLGITPTSRAKIHEVLILTAIGPPPDTSIGARAKRRDG